MVHCNVADMWRVFVLTSFLFFLGAASAVTPTITGVTPNPVPALNGAQSFVVRGTNFQSTATVTLRGLTNSQTFTLRPFTFHSASQLTLVMSLQSELAKNLRSRRQLLQLEPEQ